MANTDRQELLVSLRKKPIEEVLGDALEQFRGERNFVVKVAASLDISVPTLHAWCGERDIQIDDYRHEKQTA